MTATNLRLIGLGLWLMGLSGRNLPIMDWGFGEPWLGFVVLGAYLLGMGFERASPAGRALSSARDGQP